MYTCVVRPFIEDSDDILDIFNELSIMSLCYLCVTYTLFVDGNFTKYQIGWVNVGLFFLNLLGNLLFIIGKTLYTLYLKLRDKCSDPEKRKLREMRKRKEKKIKL